MERFLIIRTSSLGDIVHSIPVAAALKEKYPYSQISWIVEERFQEILTGHPCIDHLIIVNFKNGLKSLWKSDNRPYLINLFKILQQSSFDVSIDLQGLTRSGLISYFSGAPVRIGFPEKHTREFLNRAFNNVYPQQIPARSHVIDKNLSLLHPLGIYTKKRSFVFEVPAAVEENFKYSFPETGPDSKALRVVIHPGAGGITKQWSPERYAEIADRILRNWKARIYLLWGPGEKNLALAVQGFMEKQAFLVPEMGIKELIIFLKKCDLLLGGDSGPLHIASALGMSVVGLYGYSGPVRNGPVQGDFRVVRSACPSSPCYRKRCRNRYCLDSIGVDQVWEALTDIHNRL